MRVPISDRLLACCSYIAPGDRVADVGCDHGYLSIYLLQQGIARSVIASDINPGPLEAARRNSRSYGVAEKMAFFLCSGVTGIPRDFDALVCAGMGGDTMVSILEAAPWLRGGQYRLVLQCQSKTYLLRRYLSGSGWHILREKAVRDGRFVYTVLEAVWDPAAPRLTAGGWWYTPALLQQEDRVAGDYYRAVVGGLRLAAQHRELEAEQQAALEELSALAGGRDWLQEEIK